jgi:glutamyl-tRNA reductase
MLERSMRAASAFRHGYEESIRTSPAGDAPIAELVVLSTCNRVEVWAACSPAAAEDVSASIRTALRGEAGNDALYVYRDLEAVRHLCRVAAGIESLVIGEPQIAGQVRRAFEAVAHRNGGAPVLAAVARTARRASRRARAETGISRRPASLSSVAVHMAAERRGGLEGAEVLIIGAGKIGRLAGQALETSGARVTIANRTLRRAQQVAARVGAQARPLSELAELVRAADVIITSTASPRPILDAALLLEARRDDGAPLLLVDIALPRNIAEDVRGLPGVTLSGIDDLRSRLSAHLDERRDEIPRVEAVIEEVLAEHGHRHADILPLIGDLRRRAERIRHRALERALRDEPIDATVRARMEHLSRVIVNKLLHEPTSRLRAAGGSAPNRDYERVIRELFALDDGDVHQGG